MPEGEQSAVDRLLEAERDCVGFTANWRPKADDPVFRSSRLSFGYFCLAAGMPMTAEQAKSLLRQIVIQVPSEADAGDRTQLAPPAIVQKVCPRVGALGRPGALEYAQGAAHCGGAGNPRFPFTFAVYYTIPGGRLAR